MFSDMAPFLKGLHQKEMQKVARTHINRINLIIEWTEICKKNKKGFESYI